MSANFWEQYDEDYTGAEPVSSGGMVPDGEYEVTVTHCAAGESKQKKTPQVQWGFTIADGPCAGRKIFKDQNITEKGMGFVRADFEKVFPKEWKFSQCMTSLETLVGARLKVKVHTKQGEQYATVYINDRIDKDRIMIWVPAEAVRPVAPPTNPGSGAQYAPAPAQPALPGMPADVSPF